MIHILHNMILIDFIGDLFSESGNYVAQPSGPYVVEFSVVKGLFQITQKQLK